MKNKHVASILNISPSYVSKVSSGLLKSDRSDHIKDLLRITDEQFTQILTDNEMEETCDCAIKYARTVVTRQYATLISQTRSKFLQTENDRSHDTTANKIFNLIAVENCDVITLLSDKRMMDVCDAAIARSRANKTRKFASLLKQLSLKLYTAINSGTSDDV